jgi:hypothetical protein
LETAEEIEYFGNIGKDYNDILGAVEEIEYFENSRRNRIF